MAKTRLSRTELNMNDIQQPEDEEMTIDLLELFRSLLKNIKLIVVLTVVFGVCGFMFTKLFITPTYTASTSIYLSPQVTESGSLDYNSQIANSKLVTNVVNLITQNNIMSEVAKNVGLESAEDVRNCTATTDDPKLSKSIANDTVNTFINRMMKNLNVRNIEIVDKAKLSYIPSGPNAKKNSVMAALIGFILGVGYSVLKMLFDRRLRNKEEAEKYLGIPVFCELPDFDNV